MRAGCGNAPRCLWAGDPVLIDAERGILEILETARDPAI